ncbi:MAG: ankyrin repeat domain-containing protein [Armatimonadetes bacterium]|nr:ankyrin repeat domain-containing protein [Armatimonadota bacterium]
MLDAALLGDADTVRKLLVLDPSLASVGGCAADGDSVYTALYLACENGHLDIVQSLVECGADIDAAGPESRWSPLAIALAHAHDDVVDFLMERQARICPHAASALGDLTVLREYARSDPGVVHALGPDGAQPLHFAGTVPMARWLVNMGADPCARDLVHDNTPARWAAADHRRQSVARYLAQFDTETELFMACALGDVPRVLACLTDHPELLDSRGRPRDLLGSGTPLHLAAERGRREVTQALLELGADPNSRSFWGHYPLHAAAMRGDRDVVELLLAYGARPDLRDRSYNATARDWALRFGKHDIADLIEHESAGQ